MLKTIAAVVFLCTQAFLVRADLKSELTALGVGAVFPGDSAYTSDAKPYNLRFDFKPAAITFPNTPADVSQIVQVAGKYAHKVAPRGGGHSYIANGVGGMDNSIIADMSHFKSIVVHTNNDTATIETGNRLGDIALALFQYGRGMPHGACPYVGIGGHANFGGFGFISRSWGLTLDVVEAIDLVLANGTITTVSATQNPDLYWAMRGSGSSFGITTAIHVRTFPAPASGIIALDTWYLNLDQAVRALSSFQDFAHNTVTLPSYFGGEFVVNAGLSPGLLSITFFSGFWGPPNQYNSTLAPWKNSMPFPPNTTSYSQGNYIESLSARFGGAPLDTSLGPDNTDTFYVKSLIVPQVTISDEGAQVGISDKAWRALFQYLINEQPNLPVDWFIEVELWGGQNSAINAVPQASTAFAYRDLLWTLQMYSYTPNHQPPYPDAGFAFNDGMANSIIHNMPNGWNYGAYTNYVDNRLDDWQRLYYANHYPALQALKSRYDPSDTFSFPTSIELL